MSYEPPFKITSKAINLISQISEKIGEISTLENTERTVQLRKKNRIRTIHSSLAIENNSLTIEQITAIIEGKRVLGPPNEIQEVKNALQAYELLLNLNPYKQNDLLKAHQLMMNDLVKHSGKYRKGGVGIFDGKGVVHVAPPADRVPFLMNDLFDWLKSSDAHPLIKSCVFHYEFEFIHPFQDGNGRIGRLWHSLILSKWKNFFAWLPIESLVQKYQKEYYIAINNSNKDGESTEFILFMLEIIKETLIELVENQKMTDNATDNVTDKNKERIKVLIKYLGQNNSISNKEAQSLLGISEATAKRFLNSLVKENLLVAVGEYKARKYIKK